MHSLSSIVNALWRLVTGERLRHDDAKGKKIIGVMDKFFRESASPIVQFVNLYEPLAKICDKLGLNSGGDVARALMGLANDGLAQGRKNYQEDSLVTFSDHYLKHISDKSDARENSSFKGLEGLVNYKNTLVDLFVAGSETTSTTLNWAILYMLMYPDVQRNVQKELDDVFGRGTLPTASGRASTPFTEAVLQEVQRKGNILNFSVQHAVGADTTLGGYFLPRGTVIFPHLGEVLYNPQFFPEPHRFDPSRYLDSEGKFMAHPKMLAFGVGRRRCLGESLARLELYMFFAGLLARFHLRKERQEDVLTDVPFAGAVNSPKPFKVIFEPRF